MLVSQYSPVYRKSTALVVGIDTYSDHSLTTLGAAEADAKAVASMLKSLELPFAVELLLGKQATRESILGVLHTFRSADSNDRLLFYFAGHGYTLTDKFETERGFLAAADTIPEKEFTALGLDEIMNIRRFSAAKHIGFIFDACFSGQALGLTRVSTVAAEKFLSRRAYQVISAGAGDQTVSDYKSMTTILIRAIKDRLADISGLITFNSLGLCLQQTLASDTGKTQLPQFGHLSGSQGGDFLLSASEHFWTIGPMGSFVQAHDIITPSPELPAGGIYTAEVDSSGRIDDVTSPTVISISAGLSITLLISGTEKRRALQAIHRLKPSWGSTRLNVYLYTILVFSLLKDHIRKLDLVVIDSEYQGYESVMKDTILRLLRKNGVKIDKMKLNFVSLARSSPARIMASRVYKGLAEPDLSITAEEVLSKIDLK